MHWDDAPVDPGDSTGESDDDILLSPNSGAGFTYNNTTGEDTDSPDMDENSPAKQSAAEENVEVTNKEELPVRRLSKRQRLAAKVKKDRTSVMTKVEDLLTKIDNGAVGRFQEWKEIVDVKSAEKMALVKEEREQRALDLQKIFDFFTKK